MRCSVHILMHWMDRIAAVVSAQPRLYDPVFQDGWGDQRALETFRREALETPPVREIDVSWKSSTLDSVKVLDGEFTSPLAQRLPGRSRTGYVRVIEPPGGTDRALLLMASFNDHNYTTRERLGSTALKAGVAIAMLENPYYGRRRPTSGQPLRTVVDFYAMGAASVIEGLALLNHLRSRFGVLGVGGYSMGGNIAALISAVSPFPLATVGLAAAYSPGPVWTDGILSRAIDWEALGGTNRRPHLAAALDSASVLNFRAPPHSAAALLAAPDQDGFIPRYAFEALHEHWEGSELRWIEGGHASVLRYQSGALGQAILDAFTRHASMA